MRQQLRRIAAIFVILLSVGALLAAQTDTVYVTKTGAKYHRAGCSSLRSSSIPMPLSQAATKYSPCKICKPPIFGAAATAAPVSNPSPNAAPVERAVESSRCQATTKKGTQCSRKAKAGSKYCWQHGG
jgi:hypothetical protein